MKSIMKIIISGFAVLCLLLTAACQRQPDAKDVNNNPIYFSDYSNKWLVINYWATWCNPCLQELPELNNLYNANKQKLLVLAVNFDSLPAAEVRQFGEKLDLNFPLLNNFPAYKFGIKDIAALPVTFLIAPREKRIITLHGPQTAKTLLQAMDLSS